MLQPRDAMLARLTDSLGTMVWAGTFVGDESGVSFVIHHHSVADMSWDELEASDDPVALARERLVAAIAE